MTTHKVIEKEFIPIDPIAAIIPAPIRELHEEHMSIHQSLFQRMMGQEPDQYVEIREQIPLYQGPTFQPSYQVKKALSVKSEKIHKKKKKKHHPKTSAHSPK